MIEKASNNINKRNNFYQRLIDRISDGYFELNLKYEILNCNKIMSQFLGYQSNEDIIGLDYFKIVSEKYHTNQKKILESLEHNPTSKSYYVEFVNEKCKIVNCLVSFTKIDNEENSFIISAFTKEIRTSIVYEEDLLNQVERIEQLNNRFLQVKEQYRNLFENAPDGMLVTDIEGVILKANKEIARLFGYRNKEDLIGKNILEHYLSPNIRDSIINTVIEKRYIKDFEMSFTGINGERLFGLASFKTLYSKKGEIVAIESVIKDITDKKNTEYIISLFYGAMESSTEGITIVDLNFKITYNNKAFAQIHGYEDKTDLLGRNITIIFNEKYAQKASMIFKTIIKKDTVKGQARTIKKDGTEVIIQYTVTTIKDENNNPIALCGVIMDVTELTHLKEEIISQNLFIEKLIDHANILISYVNKDGTFTLWNKKAEELTGYSHSEIKSLDDFSEFLYPNVDDEMKGLSTSFLKVSDDNKQIETTIVTKQIEKKILELSISSFFEENNSFEGNIITGIDITERKKIEERLRLLSSAIEMSFDGICITDLEGKIIYVNQSQQKMYGYREDELIGKKVSIFYTGFQYPFIPDLFEVIYKFGNWKGELESITKEKHIFPVSSSISLITTKIGQPISIVVINRDISEIKRLILQLQKVNIDLERIIEERTQSLFKSKKYEVIGKLAAGIAHEIRNPLTSITIYTEYIQNTLLLLQSPEIKYSKRILTEIDRLNNLVDSVLSYSKTSSGNFDYMDLYIPLSNALALLESQFQFRKIELIKNYSPNLPFLLIDRNSLEQVFINVLLNSMKAIKNDIGKIIITTKAHSSYIEIIINDNGAGINDEILPNIFDPFFTTDTTGTGLGLSIVKNIMEEHRGEIHIESGIDQGTTVYLRLPINRKWDDNV